MFIQETNICHVFCFAVDVIGNYNGKVFDERSVSFAVGDATDSGLPEGVDVAVRKFKKGEKSKLTLKPEYAFGTEGSESYNIPADATVVYEVGTWYHMYCTSILAFWPVHWLAVSVLSGKSERF